MIFIFFKDIIKKSASRHVMQCRPLTIHILYLFSCSYSQERVVAAHRRHDISDSLWELLKPHLPGREGAKGVATRDNRLFINAFFGFYELVLHGATCRRTMATEKTNIADFADGGTMGFGKSFLKSFPPLEFNPLETVGFSF